MKVVYQDESDIGSIIIEHVSCEKCFVSSITLLSIEEKVEQIPYMSQGTVCHKKKG